MPSLRGIKGSKLSQPKWQLFRLQILPSTFLKVPHLPIQSPKAREKKRFLSYKDGNVTRPSSSDGRDKERGTLGHPRRKIMEKLHVEVPDLKGESLVPLVYSCDLVFIFMLIVVRFVMMLVRALFITQPLQRLFALFFKDFAYDVRPCYFLCQLRLDHSQ